MNERIRELAEQAWIADSLEFNPKWKKTDITEHLLRDMEGFHKKFAQLIAQECAGLCLADYDADIIQAHFGIE